MGTLFTTLLILIFPSFLLAQQQSNALNQSAVSQGVASPAMGHTTLFSNGFTFENPVGASYQSDYHLTAAVDGTETTSFGAELGVGDTQYGFSLGAYSNACEDGVECEAYVRGALSAIWGGFGLGFGIQEDMYTVGMLFNPNGMHRVGFVAEFEDPDGLNNRRSAFGLGYAMVLNQFTFALDLANRQMEDPFAADDALLVSPGIIVRVDIFSVTLSYDYFMNDSNNRFNDRVWVGISARAFSNMEFTFYGEYIDRWTLMMNWYF